MNLRKLRSKMRKNSNSTYNEYKKHLQRFFERTNNDDPKGNDVDDYIQELLDNGTSPSTVNIIHSAFKKYFRSIGKPNEMDNVDKARVRYKEADFLSKEEINLIVNNANGFRDKVIISLMYEAALRPGELQTIECDDIDFKKGELRIKVEKKRQEQDIHYVPLGKTTLHLLKEYRDIINKESGMLFAIGGEPIKTATIHYILQTACNNADINKKISPKILRHSRGTHLINEGINIAVVSKFLRHKNIKTTMTYVHQTSEDLKNKIPSGFD